MARLNLASLIVALSLVACIILSHADDATVVSEQNGGQETTIPNFVTAPSTATSTTPRVITSTTRRPRPTRPQVTSIAPSTTEAAEMDEVHEKWKRLEKDLKKRIEGIIKQVMPQLVRMGMQAKVSGACSNSLLQFLQGLREMKAWAVRMLDASGKLPTGVLDGTLSDFGDYDECLNIVRYQDAAQTKIRFKGQYCTVELTPELPPKPKWVTLRTRVLDFSNFSAPDSAFTDFSKSASLFYLMLIRIGACVPSTCSRDDLQEVLGVVLKDMPLSAEVRNCEIKEKFLITDLTTLQISMIAVLGTLILLAVIGTIADLYTKRSKADEADSSCNALEKGKLLDTLIAFSIDKNLKSALKSTPSKENFGVLNGLRCLSMMWIILVHTYGFSHRQAYARMENARESLEQVTFQTIINAWLSVDTFFVLGAFLVAHSNLKKLERKNGRMSLIRYFLHRLWRLTPPVGATLAIVFLLPLVGSGPLWEDVLGTEVAYCKESWWKAILPLNTWMNYKGMCLIHTWYISADIHFYFIAPLILFPLYKWPVVGFMVMGFITLICMGVTAAVTIMNDFYPTVLYFTPDEWFTKKMLDLVYFRPYPHMGAYCAGLALGYIVFKHRNAQMKPLMQVLGWCAAIALNCSIMYGTYQWNRGFIPGMEISVPYAMLHRTGWGIGIAWLIYMCVSERAGILNTFLSWRFFIPLSRLCYSVYLLHFPVLWVRSGLRRQRILFHHYDIVYDFMGTMVMTVAFALSFHILFEAPFLNLEEVWFPKNSKKPKSTLPVAKHDVVLKIVQPNDKKSENGFENAMNDKNSFSQM